MGRLRHQVQHLPGRKTRLLMKRKLLVEVVAAQTETKHVKSEGVGHRLELAA